MKQFPHARRAPRARACLRRRRSRFFRDFFRVFLRFRGRFCDRFEHASFPHRVVRPHRKPLERFRVCQRVDEEFVQDVIREAAHERHYFYSENEESSSSSSSSSTKALLAKQTKTTPPPPPPPSPPKVLLLLSLVFLRCGTLLFGVKRECAPKAIPKRKGEKRTKKLSKVLLSPSCFDD